MAIRIPIQYTVHFFDIYKATALDMANIAPGFHICLLETYGPFYFYSPDFLFLQTDTVRLYELLKYIKTPLKLIWLQRFLFALPGNLPYIL
jgi:hypothetical protein